MAFSMTAAEDGSINPSVSFIEISLGKTNVTVQDPFTDWFMN
jgi:hypothetical protein